MGCCETKPLTFKSFIHQHDDAKILASSLGATVVFPEGKELDESGPSNKENANASLIACCGSFKKYMRDFGFVPFAAPIMDFSDLGLESIIRLKQPHSFSIFVTKRNNLKLKTSLDLRDRGNFRRIAINDCHLSGGGILFYTNEFQNCVCFLFESN